MFSLLLTVLYLSFISMGLPDSLLGAAWPSMYPQLQVPVSYAGILSVIISGGTVLSSLLAGRMLQRFGTGAVAACSVLLTACALWGYASAGSFAALCCYSVPYGLGAGAVDTALNHYAAVHYPARHMNWLHCCWGIGCILSPYIMSLRLSAAADWQSGYRTVAVLQLLLTGVLFSSLPLWKHTEPAKERTAASSAASGPVLRIPGAKGTLAAFFCSCALENTTGLWSVSYLVQSRGFRPERAAAAGTLFYIGITAGRLLAGSLSARCSDRSMIRAGLCITAAGIGILMLPPDFSALSGLFVTGFGCAPVYPCMLHETPQRFSRASARRLIGLQTASAYLGAAWMPPLTGILAAGTGMRFLPLYLSFYLFLSIIAVRASHGRIASAANRSNQSTGEKT